MTEPSGKQLLHIVLGGELKSLTLNEFKDLSKIDFVGAYPNYAAAYHAWKGAAQLLDDFGFGKTINFGHEIEVRLLVNDDAVAFRQMSGDDIASRARGLDGDIEGAATHVDSVKEQPGTWPGKMAAG